MYQPNPEKICTFQAATMAAQQVISNVKKKEQKQVHETPHEFCSMLVDDLNYWLKHLLECKIKFGKVQAKHGNKDVRSEPIKVVQEFLQASPPPVGFGLKVKKSNITGVYVAESYTHVTDADGNLTLVGKKVDKNGVTYRTTEEKRKWQQENYKKHTCKFWRIDGNCRFGDDCKFRHDFDNETLRTVGPTGIFILQRTQKFSVLGVIESASTTNTSS